MPDPIFERYKEALRAGHVAALRGRPDDALLQYRSAAAIAPDRALPHVGMAEVLLRTGRLDEAQAACTVALRLAPHDESVLELAARVHEAAGRGTDASTHLDRVVDLREKQGRTGDALAAATRAHAADPTDARRDRVAALTAVVEAERARLSNPAWAPEASHSAGSAPGAGDDAAVAPPPAVPAPVAAGTSFAEPARAEGTRPDADGQAAAPVAVASPGDSAAPSEATVPVEANAPGASKRPDTPADKPAGPADKPAGPAEGDASAAMPGVEAFDADAALTDAALTDAAAGDAAAGAAVDRPARPDATIPVPDDDASPSEDGPAGAGSRSTAAAVPAGEEEPGASAAPVADPGALFVAAEEKAAAGDPAGAARLYVEAAGAYLGTGAVDTAVDACLRALSGAPADTDVHLALARIDVATGHDARAADRLDLLGRLLSLEGDEAGVARVAAFRAEAGPVRERAGSTPGASATHRQA